MTSPLWGKYCDGGHYCSAPKECCAMGCCYATLPAEGIFGLWFLGHWYFWALVTAALVAVLCICSLWRRCWHFIRYICCLCMSGRDEHASEPDSTGSCYAPPHYSRCSSFHHAPPPPYAEVTSKPDLYPLVINYNGDTSMKRGGSASYLMVQYFRNYILRPSGSISATSTIDSLSSSFICNAANEANTVIPPPYSCTGSLEGFTFSANSTSIVENTPQMLHSASSLTCNNDYQQSPRQLTPTRHCPPSTATLPHPDTCPPLPQSPKYHSNRIAPTGNSAQKGKASAKFSPVYVHNKTTSFINNIPRYDFTEPSFAKIEQRHVAQKKVKRSVMSTENSIDSETSQSQGDEHNFSELLNLSVCAPSSNCDNFDVLNPNLAELQSYSVNSVTVSDISSLANLGTPDSPPRATSPTVEIRELLDKIQQLPQQKSPAPDSETVQKPKFFIKNKTKTLYMPLSTSQKAQTTVKLSPNTSKTSVFGATSLFTYAGKTKNWLSRSAPTTPCGNFVPIFPTQKRKNTGPKSHTGSKSKMDDSSALLTEFDGSEDDQHNNKQDECL